ncbi:MAG: PcfJ domain-containing protein [Butyrivibrio sp.]|nr:PcfJ domain-containing protein [Butyrivibrio sp.]
MLEVIKREKSWYPPAIAESYIDSVLRDIHVTDRDSYDWVEFLITEPYIDILLISVRDGDKYDCCIHRFTFSEDYCWNQEEEEEFEEFFLNSKYPVLFMSSYFDRIYAYYSEKYPGWHLKRYFTNPERLLDHIHHCMKQNTIKELLYKAGLDELAVRAPKADEVNLLASSPAEIYEVPYRVVKALNCKYGAQILSDQGNRESLKELNRRYPDMFKVPLNDPQCAYLIRLLGGNLEWPEIYRLFMAGRQRLANMWSYIQYANFVSSEDSPQKREKRERLQRLANVDPVFEKYMDKIDRDELGRIAFYLLDKREEFDRDIRRSIRKRNPDWQERDGEYVVRYPQTICDFCREAVYMSNCLLTYLEAFVENETDILFMREESDVNRPFITIEIHKNALTQAYHRFNRDCNANEAEWIRDYCRRHGIDCDGYKFNWNVDML